MLKEWKDLPKFMQTKEVYPYYEHLRKKKISLILKRGFDFTVAILMLFVLSPVMIGIAIAVTVDSSGGVFFRQERITQYGRKFRIFKFRTMVANAESFGSQVTALGDMRVTKIGRVLRKYRLDELPQLINILWGDMSYVGTRPEVPRFVQTYTPEMMATLLLPAGVTSEASIQYKDESQLLELAFDVDKVYISQVLPKKMEYNLRSVKQFSFLKEIGTMIKTVLAVLH